MKRKPRHIIFAFGFFSFFCGEAQEFNTIIEGRVYSKDGDVAATHISNSTRNRGTIADHDGFFTIIAQLNDTLVFSAVQFKKKAVIVTMEIFKSKKLQISLEEALTQLNEVVVKPYNPTGELGRDMNGLETGSIITASTENLANATKNPLTPSQRKLYTARTWDAKFYGLAFTAKLDPLFNYFLGRTKMLNRRVAQDAQVVLTHQFRKYYADTFYIQDLKIPKKKIDDFVYFCAVDSSFTVMAKDRDKLKLWEFMKKKSLAYRENNNLD